MTFQWASFFSFCSISFLTSRHSKDRPSVSREALQTVAGTCLFLLSGQAVAQTNVDINQLPGMERFAYEAFCNNNQQQIQTISSALGTPDLTKQRATQLASFALQNCPERNTGPFHEDGAFWDKNEQTAIGWFFRNAANPHSVNVAAHAWQSVDVYEVGQERTLLGRASRSLNRSGGASVLAPYLLFDHAIRATYTRTSVDAGVFGPTSNREIRFSWGTEAVSRMIGNFQQRLDQNHVWYEKFKNPLDVPNCFGFPPLAIAAKAGRYDIVVKLLDRTAGVDFEVPPFETNFGILSELVEPDSRGKNRVRFKEGFTCVTQDQSGGLRRASFDIADFYKSKGVTIPFFDYFLTTFTRRDETQKNDRRDALVRITERVSSVSPGVLVQMLERPQLYEFDISAQPIQELVKTLISKGADINWPTSRGQTVLRYWMDQGIRPEVFRFLTSVGARPDTPTRTEPAQSGSGGQQTSLPDPKPVVTAPTQPSAPVTPASPPAQREAGLHITTTPAGPRPIRIRSTNIRSALNVAPASGGSLVQFGPIISNAPPYRENSNSVTFGFVAPADGNYKLRVRYAAALARPVAVSVNGQMVVQQALAEPTGCWEFRCQRWVDVGSIRASKGDNELMLNRDSVFPHISELELVPE